jgi:hypothetical protein
VSYSTASRVLLTHLLARALFRGIRVLSFGLLYYVRQGHAAGRGAVNANGAGGDE